MLFLPMHEERAQLDPRLEKHGVSQVAMLRTVYKRVMLRGNVELRAIIGNESGHAIRFVYSS